jgi:hypothetical protein
MSFLERADPGRLDHAGIILHQRAPEGPGRGKPRGWKRRERCREPAVAPAPLHGNGGAAGLAAFFRQIRCEPAEPEPRRRPMIEDRDSLLRRLHELRSEHRDLDTVIARMESGPVDQLQLQRLKKRKLKLKDEIAWLESRLVPDIIA